MQEYKTYNRRLAVEKVAATGEPCLDHLMPNYKEYLLMAALESAARSGQVRIMEGIATHDPMDSAESYEPCPDPEELYEASIVPDVVTRAGQHKAVKWMLRALGYSGKTRKAFKEFERVVRENHHGLVELMCECCTESDIYSILLYGLSHTGSLDVTKTIFETCLQRKLSQADTAKNLLSLLKLRDEETVKFLNSVQHKSKDSKQ